MSKSKISIAFEPELRTLGVLANTLPKSLALKVQRWTAGGQFGFLFDNTEDTVSFSRFQCFDFSGHGAVSANSGAAPFLHPAPRQPCPRGPRDQHVFKAFFIDEAWTFFRNPRIKGYIVEASRPGANRTPP